LALFDKEYDLRLTLVWTDFDGPINSSVNPASLAIERRDFADILDELILVKGRTP
jgi:hypothetical protein